MGIYMEEVNTYSAAAGEAVKAKSSWVSMVMALYLAAAMALFVALPFVVFPSLNNLSLAEQIESFYLLYLVGVVYLGAGVWMFRLRGEDALGRSFGLFATSTGVVLGGWYGAAMGGWLSYVWVILMAVLGGSLFDLALLYPRQGIRLRKAPALRMIGYVLGVGVALNVLVVLNNPIENVIVGSAWQAQFIFVGGMLGVFFIGMSARRFGSASPVEQEQTRLAMWSFVISFVPYILWLGGGMVDERVASLPSWPFLMLFAVFPAAVASSVLRYRLVNTDYLLSRGLLYGVLTTLAGVGYALAISGMTLLLNSNLMLDNPFVVGVLVFLMALVFNPVRDFLQRRIDTLFFRGRNIYQQQLQTFRNEIAQAVDQKGIVSLLRQYVHQHFEPTRMHLYIYNPLVELYLATEDNLGKVTTDIRFPQNGALANMLVTQQTAVYVDDLDRYPELRPDGPRLALLGTNLFIAMAGQSQMAGWIALGPRRTGEKYSSQDLAYLISLAEHVGVAVERVQVMADIDRREHEMNVLTRVAQGVNITLDFDNILELLYAQTRQVITLDDFNITLYNKITKTLQHAFYSERDERDGEKESQMIPPGQGLEREVMEAHRQIITDDYERECRNRRTIPTKRGIYSWMGVPLNAGAEIIGVIAMGSRDPAVIYSEEQYNIMQAIADQAAGAIVKARLLTETESRAKQLATLNEVTRSLTSTLELDPLLESVLGNAVEILDCEAGSLLLVDQETEEMVFEAVVGDAADDFLNTRMAPGVGVVGQSAIERKPVIVNNVEHSDQWFAEPDEQTGFSTRGLLVVPMIFKDRVIGVIEVINKKDLMPFNQDDTELLEAFAGQAAIAVENVRLFTLTDQELASRVEELSVMQRIDRELNTTLDMSQAMSITLEWAIRHSEATAGFIGIIREQGLQIMASEGYSTELKAYEDAPMTLDSPTMQEAVETGRLAHMDARFMQGSAGGFLNGVKSQLVVPLRQEAGVMGILLLESGTEDRFGEESQEFMVRLTDHAVIAITNARLYAEVQRANIAKSEFVSFVSHELKTPMTSIKGYADLLIAGAVGEVSESQGEFLNTIRTNIGRMATLVSDLADVSRIEAGNLHMEFRAVDVREYVDETLNAINAMIKEKQHEVVIDIPEDIAKVWGDKNRLMQVLTNLISNAYKYTLEGGTITIWAKEADNQWDPEGAPRVVHLGVKDSGIGIKEEDQKKIFTQYFRTDDGKDTASGTGLGLNITQNLVEMQGGKIWFESVFGEGTTFQYTMPVTEAEQE